MITNKDIAKIANVSEATVSLALNGKPGVNAETRNKIFKIAEDNGYQPSFTAQSLSKNVSGNIGLVIPDIENPYFGKLAKCIDENVRKAGFSTTIELSNENPHIESKILANFISNKVEGIIIAPTSVKNGDTTYIERIEEEYGIPCVFTTSHYPGLKTSVVMTDLADGCYKLVSYLLSIGHRDIFFLVGIRDLPPTAYRLDGYVRAFADYNLTPSDSMLYECSRGNFDEAYYATARLLKSGRKIDAIITLNDIMALGVLKVLTENNIRIPEDISVAGYDNLVFSSVSTIPITTVSQNIELISYEAVNMLMRKKSNMVTSEVESIFIKPELIIRQSTGLNKGGFLPGNQQQIL